MLITNHVLAGAVIGALSTSNRSAFTSGLVSHFALDAAPHWGTPDHDRFLTVAVIDGLIGATVMGAIALLAPKEKRSRVRAGMVGAVLPDMDKPSKQFFGTSPFPKPIDAFHARIQIESEHQMCQEVLVGSLLSAVAVGVLRDRMSNRRG